ncbi:probable disease resistance protein RF45 [Nymphaea colorata]|uniref:probable disease resistance protein RF45 n=1 Tax=Nymphaea colorata TaxID=210225 RepID=UPI00129DE0CE|nr:probable disease resistance protein RF45 [Nymphaea colorata]
MAGVIGALVETAISNLVGAVTNLLKEKTDVILNANDDLKKLRRELKIFQKAIKDADRKPFLSNEREKDWDMDLVRLKPKESSQGPSEDDNPQETTHHIGEGGIGKTTLAKMVFSEVEQQFRERSWWVCVSKRPNRKDLLRKILKEVCKGSRLLAVQIWNKRFLLILDDV